jgi:large subunit ribosomal protein L31
MKKDIHPKNHRLVIFEDSSSGKSFLIPSTVPTDEKGKWEDGKEYPLYKIEISSASHPFYTGNETVLDAAGRVDKFKKRQAVANQKKEKAVKK